MAGALTGILHVHLLQHLLLVAIPAAIVFLAPRQFKPKLLRVELVRGGRGIAAAGKRTGSPTEKPHR